MSEALKQGTEVEMEHQGTYDWFMHEIKGKRTPTAEDLAERIAMDHLKESKEYYTYLEAMEELMLAASE